MRLSYGSAGTSRNVRALHTRAVGQGGQLFVGVFGRDVGLSLVGLGDELPERIVRRLRDAVGVGGPFRRPVVHFEGKVLEDETRIGLGRDESLDRRLGGLAGRTL